MNRLNDNRHIPFVHQSHEQRMLLEASLQFAVSLSKWTTAIYWAKYHVYTRHLCLHTERPIIGHNTNVSKIKILRNIDPYLSVR